MIAEKYHRIKGVYIPDYQVPEGFFLPPASGEKFCVFLISCLSKDKFLYLDQDFSELTGYSNDTFVSLGMDFWFSLIRPQDMEHVTSEIINAHKAMFSPGYEAGNPKPLILKYHFKHANGHWIPIRDTRYLVSFNADKVIDKVLCRFETIPAAEIDFAELAELLNKEKSCTKMLEHAMVHQNSKNKQIMDGAGASSTENTSGLLSVLTKREKEILQLIAQGLSTKMIADRCFISVHTVETHRRHLLEKLQVKNSMELVKKASKIFWLQ